MTPRVCVLMPTFEQEHFIGRAISSLAAQTFVDWELRVIDDGSSDATRRAIEGMPSDPRIHYFRIGQNTGVGAALNVGLRQTEAPLIAYLPSDDVYHADHLGRLIAILDENPDAVLAFSGVQHHYNRLAPGAIDGHGLQLVQVMHRRVDERWVDRNELVTDDLERMYWSCLDRYGRRVGTGEITCQWVDHPDQLHKLLREPVGGINLYRQRFGVSHPLRYHTTVGNAMDEGRQYRRFREREDTPRAADGLKILLVGELAYNAERVLALEERGHKLYGLWMKDPYWYNTVGPVPFGHVEDLPRHDWQRAVRQVRPDVIYALLNWQAVPFAHEVLIHNPGVPLVWHFKEGPFICLERGTWPKLVDLYTRSDGQIYSSPEMREWFEKAVPQTANGRSMVLDGDLPKADWFVDDRLPRLSEKTGEYHTVVPGRPIGLHPQDVQTLAHQAIHLHFYGNFMHGQWREWIEKTGRLAPGYLHLHAQVDSDQWVREFSQYDAGWLHFFQSQNRGELARANWDDLNYPARMSTLAAAGLPLVQRDNRGAIVATQSLVRRLDIGVLVASLEELRERLDNRPRMNEIRQNVWDRRMEFTFDQHADRLVTFFRAVIEQHGGQR